MRSVRSVSRARRPFVALVALVVALAVGYTVRAASSDDPGGTASSSSVTASASTGASAAAGEVALSSLPAEVARTVRLIRSGGPFAYPEHDGSVFRNDEQLLPSRPAGYYREYTVPTPGSDDRGARRLITGSSGEFYYTGDHYESFDRVDVTR